MPQCIFCEAKKTSKEHLWGKWWQKFYPPTEESLQLRGCHQIDRQSTTGEIAIDRGHFSNVGDPLSWTTKVVCKDCNSNWMSQIENDMKQAFETLYIDSENEISPETSLAIKKWMFLKFCLLDRAYEKIPIISKTPHREEFTHAILRAKKHRWKSFNEGAHIPNDFRFFISKCVERTSIGSFQHIPSPLLSGESVSKIRVKLVDACSLNVGIFAGVVTNNEKLSEHLSNLPRQKCIENPFNELKTQGAKMANSQIKGEHFEEVILSKLESDIREKWSLNDFKLRRNFDPINEE